MVFAGIGQTWEVAMDRLSVTAEAGAGAGAQGRISRARWRMRACDAMSEERRARAGGRQGCGRRPSSCRAALR